MNIIIIIILVYVLIEVTHSALHLELLGRLFRLIYNTKSTVSWARQFIACISPRKTQFDPTPVHVGFLVEKAALRQVFLDCFGCPLQHNCTNALHLFIHYQIHYIISAKDSALQNALINQEYKDEFVVAE
jgi:hypothetical protein